MSGKVFHPNMTGKEIHPDMISPVIFNEYSEDLLSPCKDIEENSSKYPSKDSIELDLIPRTSTP